MKTEDELIAEKLKVIAELKAIITERPIVKDGLFERVMAKLDALELLEDDPEEYFNLKYNG